MNILTGYISCTDGKALIDGVDILEDPIKAKKQIGYLPELPPLYMDMTVKEYLYFVYKNHTVILSSHILSEVQAVCDKIIVINEGKVVANDTEEHLSQKLSGEHKLTAKIQGDKDKIVRAMQGIKGVEKVICDASHKDGVNDIRIEAKEGVDIRRDVFETVVKKRLVYA